MSADKYSSLPPEPGTPLISPDQLSAPVATSRVIRFTPPVDPPEPWAPGSGHGDHVFALTNIDYFLLEQNGPYYYFHIGFIRHNTRWRHKTDCYMDFFNNTGGLVHTHWYLRMEKDNNWGTDAYSITQPFNPPGLVSEIYRATSRLIVREKEIK